jgi:tetratricopeptide (TPR) repeat protein
MEWRRLLQQAVSEHQCGNLVNAITLYHGVLQQQPDNADALHLIGMALEQAGHPDKGLPFVEQAVRLAPATAAFSNTLGTVRKALGDAAGARAAYAAAVQLDPANAEVHNNLGLLAREAADWPTALQYFADALAADPGYLPARFNLAVAGWQETRSPAALTALRDVLAQAPAFALQILQLARSCIGQADTAGARQMLDLLEPYATHPADWQMLEGGIAALEGDAVAAERAYRAALEANPDHVQTLGLLGRLLLERGAHAEALPLLERLHMLQPGEPGAVAALGFALARCGRFEEAIPYLLQMVAARPDEPAPWADLAEAYASQNRFDEGCDAYRRAIALDPDRAELYANLAGLETRRGDLAAAEAMCNAALARDPSQRAARGNLANIRGLQKRFDEAEALYAALLADHPDDGTSHNNLAIMRLRQGRYAEAWPHFDWRWSSDGWTTPDRSRGLPRWDGSYPLPGRLLLWREQGIGDEILYGSMLPDLAARGADLVVATDRRLVPLFARSFPAIRIVADEPGLDVAALGLACQRPMGDLGSLVRPDQASFAGQPQGYLQADAALRDRLRQRYRASLDADGLLVGVAWSSRNAMYGGNKSIALADMAPLLSEPGLRAVCLQYGQVAEDIAGLQAAAGLTVHADPQIDPLASIDAQAAQIAALDAVVTISTAAAHLSAGLGLPTLILLPDERGVLWYWGHQGDRTPWYGSARICRSEPGEPVASLIRRALPVWRDMLAGARRAPR